MTDPPTDPTPPTRPVSRWSVGTLSVLQILLFGLIVLAVNFLSAEHYGRRDLSRDSDYSLAPATVRYIQSKAIQDRADPIKIILAFRRIMPFYERVRATCEEYERLSHGRLSLEVLDPIRSPDRAQQIAASYGVASQDSPLDPASFHSDLLIIDARTEAEKSDKSPDAAKTKSARVRFVEGDNMLTYSVEKGQRKISGFQGEEAITANLVSAIEGTVKKLYLIEDKSNLESEGPRPPRQFLEGALRSQNILLAPLQIANLEAIPDDAAGIAIIAPSYDFSAAEIAVLESYWTNRAKSGLLVMVGAKETPPALRAFLRKQGVTPRHDRVITRKSGQTVSTVGASFTAGLDFTRDLAGKSTVFEGATCSLDVRERDDADLMMRALQPYSIIQSAPGFWGETKFGDGKETFDPREDHGGPLSLAAAVVRGAANNDRFAASTSRMVVIGNSDILSPDHNWEANLDFLKSSANWLVGREDLAGAGPHAIGTYKLPLLDAQVAFVNRINLMFLPAFALLTAAFIWASRRS